MASTRLIALTACVGLLGACVPEGGVDLSEVEIGAPVGLYEVEALPAMCKRDDVRADTLIAAVNSAREIENKTTLEVDRRLNEIAQNHACDMAQMGKATVAGSDGQNVVARARAVGYPTCGVIQMGWIDGTADGAVARGLRSPAHREQLLGQLSDQIGSGLTIGSDGRQWWSLVIGDDCR